MGPASPTRHPDRSRSATSCCCSLGGRRIYRPHLAFFYDSHGQSIDWIVVLPHPRPAIPSRLIVVLRRFATTGETHAAFLIREDRSPKAGKYCLDSDRRECITFYSSISRYHSRHQTLTVHEVLCMRRAPPAVGRGESSEKVQVPARKVVPRHVQSTQDGGNRR